MTKLDNLVKIIEEELQPQKKASTKNHDEFYNNEDFKVDLEDDENRKPRRKYKRNILTHTKRMYIAKFIIMKVII
jgi:hypothetical protein